jgi:XTP/dITP diphosphohydrolase
VRPLLVATRSRGKQAELRRLLAPLGRPIVFPEDIGLAESPQEATLEVARTFEENARAKARWFAAASGLDAIADDSGLEVDALDGAPGVRSKRFAGRDGPDHEVTAANNAELLRRLEGVPAERRGARYRCSLVLVPSPAKQGEGPHAERSELAVDGTASGRILTEPQGTGGFGYDPLFWSEDLRMSFGNASAEDKGRVSHRGRAVEALIRALSS